MSKWLRNPIFAVLAIVALLAVSAPRSAAAADVRDFTLVNGSPTITITHLYIAPSASEQWGGDVLGRDVLWPGESTMIVFGGFDAETSPCVYDIWVDGLNEFGEPAQGVLWGVDLCATSTVTFS